MHNDKQRSNENSNTVCRALREIGVAVAKEDSQEKILEAVYQMQDYYNDVMED